MSAMVDNCTQVKMKNVMKKIKERLEEFFWGISFNVSMIFSCWIPTIIVTASILIVLWDVFENNLYGILVMILGIIFGIAMLIVSSNARVTSRIYYDEIEKRILAKKQQKKNLQTKSKKIKAEDRG